MLIGWSSILFFLLPSWNAVEENLLLTDTQLCEVQQIRNQILKEKEPTHLPSRLTKSSS
jgi:hypothetical protein